MDGRGLLGARADVLRGLLRVLRLLQSPIHSSRKLRVGLLVASIGVAVGRVDLVMMFMMVVVEGWCVLLLVVVEAGPVGHRPVVRRGVGRLLLPLLVLPVPAVLLRLLHDHVLTGVARWRLEAILILYLLLLVLLDSRLALLHHHHLLLTPTAMVSLLSAHLLSIRPLMML